MTELEFKQRMKYLRVKKNKYLMSGEAAAYRLIAKEEQKLIDIYTKSQIMRKQAKYEKLLVSNRFKEIIKENNL